MTTTSKSLAHDDHSGSAFTREMLAGDPTYGINFDRVQWDSDSCCYVIVELLLCEESQPHVTPHSSHPNRYFHSKTGGSYGNAMKFIGLWELALAINAKLYLVNYAKAGTKHADEVRLMLVSGVDPADLTNPVKTSEDHKLTRGEYKKWFRGLNDRGRKSDPLIKGSTSYSKMRSVRK